MQFSCNSNDVSSNKCDQKKKPNYHFFLHSMWLCSHSRAGYRQCLQWNVLTETSGHLAQLSGTVSGEARCCWAFQCFESLKPISLHPQWIESATNYFKIPWAPAKNAGLKLTLSMRLTLMVMVTTFICLFIYLLFLLYLISERSLLALQIKSLAAVCVNWACNVS